jgi:hypothetical protein
MGSLTRITALGGALFLAACGGGSVDPSPISPLPTASISASRTTVNSGEESTLTWSSTGATSCNASGGWSGALAASGTRGAGALTADTTFSLTCTGAGGTSPAATVKIAVNVAPTATLSANPTSVTAGGASTLSWSSTNAATCTASGGWSGALATAGTQSTGALMADATFSLSCTGPSGTSAAAMATVSVTAPAAPTVTLAAKPAVISAGGTSTLTWSSTNATSCSASGGWTGTLAARGTQSTGAIATNTSYSLACNGAAGTSVVATATVSVIPTVTLTVYPTVVATGGASTLTWSSTNATSCSASGGWTATLAARGSQGTGAVAANTSYSITCSGAGGTSAVATVAVTVSDVAMSLSPKIVAITMPQTQQFAATVPGGGAATWTVDGIAGGNSTVGIVSATGLFSAGTAAGAHTIVATSVANTAQSASAVAAVTDLAGVYTYHNNLARDGTNTREYALTPSRVTAAGFGKRAACPVDGAIYTQPLWAANLTVNGAKHNVVFVATQHDGLYAFDADASPCAMLWSVSLIDAAHGGSSGETSVPGNLVGVGDGDIQPEIGVTGTPVIDPVARILYVVSKSINSAQTTFFQRLHAIDLATGNEKPGSPAAITGTYPGTGSNGTTVSFNPRQENQRAGLALVNGIVYIAWSGHEDAPPYYGWMLSYQYDGAALTQKAAINVTPNTRFGGIWMGGGAPSVDSNNNLYVLTGNGNFDATSSSAPNNDYGDSLLKLNTALRVSQYFTPSDQQTDNLEDEDFGAGGTAILADLPAGNTITHTLICGGKDGSLYVLNRDLLGGFGDPAAVQKIAFGHPIYATGAFWNDHFYLGGIDGPLTAYQLATGTPQFNPTPSSKSTHLYGFAGITPSISAAAAQNGVVWALDTKNYCTQESTGCGPVVLYAYDAANVATELWNSSLKAADTAGYAVKFTVPTVANGRVYVGTRGNNIGGADNSTSVAGELDIYGLKP